jgi:DNA-binding response OmpR family regulator
LTGRPGLPSRTPSPRRIVDHPKELAAVDLEAAEVVLALRVVIGRERVERPHSLEHLVSHLVGHSRDAGGRHHLAADERSPEGVVEIADALARRELRARGVPVPIGGRAFEIIEVLVQPAGELVTKNDLMDRVWPGATVEDNTLQFHISAIRKVLGPDREILKTEYGRGYRLLGAWTFRQAIALIARPD